MVNRRAWGTLRPPTVAAGASYQGPGDIVTSGWVYWGGLRAFKADTRGDICCRIKNDTSPFAEADIETDATTGIIRLDQITAHMASDTAKVIRLYDQSGAGRDTINAGPPPVVISTFGSSPIAMGVGGCNSAAVGTTYNQPITFMAVAQRAVGTGFGRVISIDTFHGIGFGADDNAFMYAGSFVIENAAEGSPHALIGVLFASADDILNVDGVDGTPAAGGAGGIDTAGLINFPDGTIAEYSFEGGILSTGLDGTQRAALSANMMDYYGIT